MTDQISLGFENQTKLLPIADILPSRIVSLQIKKTKKYAQILVSVREVGLVEPLVVFPQGGTRRTYMLLDGHLRLAALQELAINTAPCMIAKDDEAFTYNKRISRLSTIQEHFMIRQALKKGVAEEKLAAALGVNVARIRQKRALLRGICTEAIDILKDRNFSGGTIGVLRKMKPIRQVETAELMIAANNFSLSYARALLMATPDTELVDARRKASHGLSAEERECMEVEMEKLRKDMKAVEEDYGSNVVRLVVANGYIRRLLENDAVSHFLSVNHDELLSQMQSLNEALDRDQIL